MKAAPRDATFEVETELFRKKMENTVPLKLD